MNWAALVERFTLDRLARFAIMAWMIMAMAWWILQIQSVPAYPVVLPGFSTPGPHLNRPLIHGMRVLMVVKADLVRA